MDRGRRRNRPQQGDNVTCLSHHFFLHFQHNEEDFAGETLQVYFLTVSMQNFAAIQIGLNMSLNMSLNRNGRIACARKSLILKVGTAGFEPTASCTPSKRATRLRHVPKGLSMRSQGQ